MKKIIPFLILVTFSFSSMGNECSDGRCVLDNDLDIINDSETSSYSQFEIRNLMRDLEFITSRGQSPRNIKFSINSIEQGVSPNVTINLPSFKKLNSGGNALMIAGEVNNLSINLSGRNGDKSHDASRICAERILNDAYGPSIKSQFLSNRISNPSLPMDRCTSLDVGNIQDGQFKCGTGFTEFDGSVIRGSRWRPRRVCEAESKRQMCVSRNVRITCTWLAEKITPGNSCNQNSIDGEVGFDPRPRGGGALGRNWVCDPTIAVDNLYNGWKLSFDPYVRDEFWLLARRNMGKTDEEICDELTQRDGDYIKGFPGILDNYYFNRNGTRTNKGLGEINGTSIRVKRGYSHGYQSDSYAENPRVTIEYPYDMILIDAATKPCMADYESGGDYESRFWNANCDNGTFFRVFDREIYNYRCSNCFPDYSAGRRSDYGIVFFSSYCTPGSVLQCDKCATNPSFTGDYIQCTGTTSFKIKELRVEPYGLMNNYTRSDILGKSERIEGSILFSENLYYGGEKKGGGSFITGARKWKNSPGSYISTSIFLKRNLPPALNSRSGELDYEYYPQPFPRIRRTGEHLKIFPTSIHCWLASKNSVRCSNSVLGEAYGNKYLIRTRAYMPNGRIIEYYVDWAISRY